MAQVSFLLLSFLSQDMTVKSVLSFKLYGNALYLWRYSFLFYSSVSAGAAFDPSADFGAAGFFGASFFFGES